MPGTLCGPRHCDAVALACVRALGAGAAQLCTVTNKKSREHVAYSNSIKCWMPDGQQTPGLYVTDENVQVHFKRRTGARIY